MKKLDTSKKFIKLLMDGKFKKPRFIKQQLNRKTYDDSSRLENYNFFMNTSDYDMIEKVKVKSYIGDNEY